MAGGKKAWDNKARVGWYLPSLVPSAHAIKGKGRNDEQLSSAGPDRAGRGGGRLGKGKHVASHPPTLVPRKARGPHFWGGSQVA